MADAAVIFDVDGVLLHLTPEEEDAFFRPFEDLHGLTGLSRDWKRQRGNPRGLTAAQPVVPCLAPQHRDSAESQGEQRRDSCAR